MADEVVRAITRVHGEEVVVAGGRFEKIDDRPGGTRPKIVIRYPAGKKRFDGDTGFDSRKKKRWRIHPEDLQRIQLQFPEKFRPILVRYSLPPKSKERSSYVSYVGRSFVPQEALDRGAPKRTLVVTLSPPTILDLDDDDVTMRRLIALARRERWDVLEVTFLFSRAIKNPTELKRDPDPVGPFHDDMIAERAKLAERVVVAWGSALTFGKHQPEDVRGRDRRVLDVLRDAGHAKVWSFSDPRDRLGGTTPRSSPPLHPQRIAFDMPLSIWTPPPTDEAT